MEHVQSVPYKVSARWLFYRLLQEGYYTEKKHYSTQFIPRFSYLRREFIDGWHPDILADESRHIIPRETVGLASIEDYADYDVAKEIMDSLEFIEVSFPLDHFYRQNYYVEIWYEANAMTGQFQHYTKDITLVPCGGYSSVAYGWKVAKALEEKSTKYGKPIVILFFGDCDYYGGEIRRVIERDVRDWSSADFELEWCGLTTEQARLFGVPENPDKEGYQWEALDDKSAGKIITEAVGKYVSQEIIDEVEKEQREHEEWVNGEIREVIDEIREPIKDLINKKLRRHDE